MARSITPFRGTAWVVGSSFTAGILSRCSSSPQGPPASPPASMSFLPDGRVLAGERPGRLQLPDGGERTEVSGLPEITAAGQGGCWTLPYTLDTSARAAYTSPTHWAAAGTRRTSSKPGRTMADPRSPTGRSASGERSGTPRSGASSSRCCTGLRRSPLRGWRFVQLRPSRTGRGIFSSGLQRDDTCGA
jgi:hypothetical protein